MSRKDSLAAKRDAVVIGYVKKYAEAKGFKVLDIDITPMGHLI
jgi:hypothetical protein